MCENKSPLIGNSPWIRLGRGRNELKAADNYVYIDATPPEARVPCVCAVYHLNVQENRDWIGFPFCFYFGDFPSRRTVTWAVIPEL